MYAKLQSLSDSGCLKGFIADLHRGVVLKQLNYPISMLPILFRSVKLTIIQTIPVEIENLLIFTDSTSIFCNKSTD